LPSGNTIQSIRFADRLNGCAVGDAGTIIRTTNGGISWFSVQSPRSVYLRGVDFAKNNPNVLVAAGDSGLILRSSNGGSNWYVTQTVAGVRFMDVDFSTSTDAYAVGLAGRIYKSTDAGQNWTQQFSPTGLSLRSVNFYDQNYGIIGGDRRIMLTSNGGVNWFVQNLTLATFDQVVGVSQLDSLTAVGAAETDGGGKCYRTTNGGIRWDTVRLNIPYPNGSGDIVRHMSFGGKNNGVICTSLGSILTTTNGGVNWKRDSTYYTYYQRNFGIGIFWSSNFSDSNTAYVAGGGGNILRSTNSGQNWNFSVGGFYDLHGTYFINPNTGWGVGEEGTIQKTTNGGNSWSFYPPVTREVLREVVFPSSDTGYICGDSGVVLKTTNSGNNWFFIDCGITALLFDVFFLNNQTGYIAGGFTSWDSSGIGWIRKTNDGGQNWTTLFYNQDSGWINEIHFFDENTGIACFDRNITRTTDGGLTWITVGNSKTGEGNGMHFPNSQTGYVVGIINTIFKTTNQGQNWTSLPTGYYGTLESVYFINSNTGYAVGYEGGIVYTSNGGSNWIWTRSVTSSFLHDIMFTDSLNGYIVGEFGNVLKTTTGGITSLIKQESIISPVEFELFQNYPNPFNPQTKITISIKKKAHITLKVCDILGKEIRTLVDDKMHSGRYDVFFNASGLPSGTYICSLYADNVSINSMKMLLIR
jgi:photosystem II stability/assembly factor-like uncharacterized protein